jgi:cholesterol transport system auxiliary component
MTAFGRARSLLLVPLAGCALLSRGKALPASYYEPEFPAVHPVAVPSPGCALDLGHVDAADQLREEIQFRTPPFQAGYYEERRWTETPDRYLRRALERRLFEGNRCVRTLSYGGATLDATLLSFAEVRSPEAARISVHILLHDGPRVLLDATVEADRAAGQAGDFDAVVRALSEALVDVVARISDQVELSLRPAAGRIGERPP